MDPMIIGTTVPFINSTAFHMYSAWLPRQGNAVRLSAEILTSHDLKLTVQTKNRAEVETDAADLGNSTGTGTVSVRVSGVKELVRYKITTNPSLEMWDEIEHIRLLDPQWER